MNERTPVAAVAGAVITVGSLSLHWFTAMVADDTVPGRRTGWEWFGEFDWFLAAVAVLGLVCAGLMGLKAPAVPIASRLVSALSAVGFLWVAYRIVAPPTNADPLHVTQVSVSVGPWVALLGLGVLGLATATSFMRSAAVSPD